MVRDPLPVSIPGDLSNVTARLHETHLLHNISSLGQGQSLGQYDESFSGHCSGPELETEMRNIEVSRHGIEVRYFFHFPSDAKNRQHGSVNYT